MFKLNLNKKTKTGFSGRTSRRTITLLLFLILGHFMVSAQTKIISGTVVDKEGIPLPGVTVLQLGTTNGTVSSIDGKYALSDISEGDSIRYSFIGFTTQIRVAGQSDVIDIVMGESSESLDEVQVVAFQKQKKESVIGSINTINPKELKVAPSNLTAAFAGKLAGVISYQRSGEPGADNAEFFIRGVTTFGYKNDPLILIDGLEVSSNDLARIEPDNIASFSIMKDATATALYGARGANGVILVTTKEGRKGKAKVSVRVENSISTPTMTNEFLGGVEYMELYNKALRTRDPNALLFYSKEKIEGTRRNLDPNIYPNVNWYNELFKTAVFNKRANMNINGGGEVAQYYLSVSYTNEKGLLKVDNLNNFNNNIDINRYNLRANVNINLTKTTRAAVKFYSLFDTYNGPVNDANSIFGSVMQANPVNFPKYYPKAEPYLYVNHTLFGNKGNGGMPNPYADMVKGYKDRFTSTILSQFQLEQDLDFITEGLKFRGMASVRNYSMNENAREFTPFYYGMAEVETEDGIQHELYQIQEGTEYLNDPVVQNQANSSFYFELVTQYNRVFGDKHDIGGLLVFTRKESMNTLGGNAYSTLPSRNLGLSGRATYAYDSRYFIEFNFGYNGSEKFAEDHRFGFFPSAGLGWLVSNEPFFENLSSVVTNLKLKATYGLVGNDAISDPNDRFFYLSDVNLNDWSRGYTFGRDFGNSYSGYIINRYSNPDVTWEVAEKSNFGLELELYEKANLQVDYFIENRSNIYWAREYTPETMGLTAPISSNIGEAESRGIDISFDYNHSINNKLWLTSRMNFTYATNKVLKNGEPDYQYDYMSHIGQSINQQWGLVAERLFIDQYDLENSPPQFNQSSSGFNYKPGDIKYVDVNEDGQIDDRDMVPIGYPSVPEIVYGAGASAGYGNFDLSFFFQGVARESFFINPSNIAPFIDERNALKIISDNHWSDDNPDPFAFWPRLSTMSVPNNEYSSTWWLRNGSFIRLKSLEFGYTIPRSVSQRIKIENIRFYASGTNLFTISKFKLWDPEMAGNGLGYPPQQIFNIGVNLTI
ncbi:SusC/RagA family TonB-linked outer membrane protein [Maribellus sediminis]|uniref:SusC/RagA family TonB-linked outer membrane protein n=1 Tax=Maribellus sediminis TaxID=2696285 RepID=UPI00197F3458|nr:TonB-dependent receptor [Maribellus sediminis]